jgi:hypothetical protein
MAEYRRLTSELESVADGVPRREPMMVRSNTAPRYALPVGMIALALAGSRAHADGQQSTSAQSDDWSLTLAPYVWAAGLKGTVATLPGLPSIDVDASFQDILENFDIGAMAMVELRHGRFGGYADIVYTSISADANTPRDVLFDSIKAENDLFIGTFGGAYRVIEGHAGFVDLLAGARAWSVDTRLTLNGGLLADQEREHNENWVDPIVGFKARYGFDNGLYLNALAQVGGFGAASDLTWDAFGGVGYQFNDAISAVAGYRHMEVDYDRHGFVFNVQLSGPVIGATIRF